MLNRAEIAARLPHAGSMVLIDRVVEWNESRIRCAALSHLVADNPLCVAGGLDVYAGIEYAAQAAALHGALLSKADAPRRGVLASVKNVSASTRWLNESIVEIFVEATLLHGDPAGAVFSFSLTDGQRSLREGQFTLMYVDRTVAIA